MAHSGREAMWAWGTWCSSEKVKDHGQQLRVRKVKGELGTGVMKEFPQKMGLQTNQELGLGWWGA